MKKSYAVDMVNGPLLSRILIYAFPLILSGVLQLLFNAADIVVVGKFTGSHALAAVGSTSALINLLVNLFIGISIGTNVMVARYCGARDWQNCEDTVHTSIAISIIGGILMIFVGILFARPLLELMGTPADVITHSVLYMRIYFLGMPAFMIYNFGAAILRAIGDTKRPLYFLTVAGIVNVIFNLFFVIVFRMGVAGVAIATVVSQVISAVLILMCLLKMDGMCQLHKDKIKLHGDKVKEMLRIGIPAGLQGIVFSISNVLIQSSVNSFGSIVMAGNTAASNIEGFVYTAMNAIYQTSLSFTSQNLGAGNTARIKKILLTLPGDRDCDRSGAGPGRLPARPAAALDLLLRSSRRRFRNDPAFNCQRDVFPVRIDGRLLRKHPRLRLFDHADARVADRRVRLPRAVDLYSFPG